jgi:hypothetical protein
MMETFFDDVDIEEFIADNGRELVDEGPVGRFWFDLGEVDLSFD